MARQARAYPSFCSIEVTKSISTPPWMGCWSITGLSPSIRFSGTHLYTWVEGGTVREKYLARQHNIMPLVRARTRTARDPEWSALTMTPPGLWARVFFLRAGPARLACSEKLSGELSLYYNTLFCRFSRETATEVRQLLTYFSTAVRIYPLKWHGNMALRLELYGCWYHWRISLVFVSRLFIM